MDSIAAGDKLRIAVALSALQIKPADESVESFVLRLRAAVGDQRDADWKRRAETAERDLKELKEKHHGETAKALATLRRKKGKDDSNTDPIELIQGDTAVRLVRGLGKNILSNLPTASAILQDIIASGSHPPSDALIDSVVDAIMYPLIRSFFSTSMNLLSAEFAPEDSRMEVLRLLRDVVDLIPSIRQSVGLFAAREMHRLFSQPCAQITQRLARKEAVWFICSLLYVVFRVPSAAPDQLLASGISQALSETILRVDGPDQVELDMILACVEAYWLNSAACNQTDPF